MNILALDVDYRENDTTSVAYTAGILFNDWLDDTAERILISKKEGIDAYTSGSFYKRELPCLLGFLSEHQLEPDYIIVDGFVYLDKDRTAGLGKKLYDELNGKSIVIGVAKKPFKNIGDRHQIYRGDSRTPLYITAEGISTTEAKSLITSMHGRYRIPTLLKLADQQCRNAKE